MSNNYGEEIPWNWKTMEQIVNDLTPKDRIDRAEVLQNEYIALLTEYKMWAKYTSGGKLTNATELESLAEKITNHPCFTGQRFRKIVSTAEERCEQAIVTKPKRKMEL